MSTNPTNVRQDPSDEAGKLMSRAHKAFRRGRMTLAYNLHGEAIARLEAMWDATQNSEVGYRLAKAYIDGCYPAWRKFLARGTKNREQWIPLALDRERLGADMYIELANTTHMTDDELVGALCMVHNFAGGYCSLHVPLQPADKIPYDGDKAEHYVNEAYKMLETQRPEEEMPPSLDKGFKYMRACVAFGRREFANAIALVDEVIADEQARVDKRRRQKKKLPPPNWLKIPTLLREAIDKAVMEAAIETVRNAKL